MNSLSLDSKLGGGGGGEWAPPASRDLATLVMLWKIIVTFFSLMAKAVRYLKKINQ